MKIIFFGDIIGKPGRRAIAAHLPELKKKHKPDLTIANGENLAHGLGITAKTVGAMFEAGIDFLTTGNHAFDKQDGAQEVFTQFAGRVIRPMNFEGGYPGSGHGSIEVGGREVTILNFNAQVFMENQFDGLISSPFRTLDQFLQTSEKSAIIIVDFHSEATSEKRGFGFYADGRVSAVLGTHTHVQTADAQVLPGGTAYISDVGMTGGADTVVGVARERALEQFLGKKSKIENMIDTDTAEMGYVVIEIDEASGKARSIQSYLERVKI